MSSVLFRARPQTVALALIAIGAAGCSSEATRFNENPYASRASTGEVTGSVSTAPSGRIEQSQLAPPPGASQPATAAPATGIVGGGRGMANYQPNNSPEVTGSVQAPPRQPAGHWTWEGGTPVTVAQGETAESIARRHNVPVAALIEANALSGPAAIAPGQRLVIPRYSTAAKGAAPSAPARAAAPAAPTATSVHVVASGDTLSKIARQHGKSVPELARANNLEPTAPLKIGDRVIIPGTRAAAAPAKAAPKASQPKSLAGPAPAPKAPAVSKQANNNEQAQQALIASPSSETPPSATAKASDGKPVFRWPVKGRVIAGFGPKANGQQNDGINVSVPEGTPIKAAEDGVVAYSGNELKGYGNLVLIRHSNGYVTAYAHAKELNVKRGDQIKRGQVIGKSGQTGNVDAPQLHFEVRKGPAPMDPMPMLSGG
jgi:murein DD-endopeptidase MepM/ murein hydrolase activator NlpD